MGAGVFAPQGFREVTFKCTQSGGNAPAIAYRLGDSFGALLGTPAWARTSAGLYTFTLTGAWVANKTVAIVVCNTAARAVSVTYTSADVITLTFNDLATPTAAESGGFDLIVRVYD